jgi:streptogramin lyase
VTTLVEVRNPCGLIEGPDGALYICSIDDHRIYRFDRETNQLTIYVDRLNEPYEVRFDRDGHLFFVDMKAHVVKRVDRKTRAVTLVAGTGEPGFSGDGGPAVKAQLHQPHAIQFDPQGRLLICDIRNHRVRRVDLKTGIIETVLGGESRPVRGPRAIDFDPSGTMWLALREGNAVLRVRTGDWSMETVAEKLHGPKGIAWSPDGGVWIADTESHEISRIDPRTGEVQVILGGLKRPHGIYVNGRGEVFVGDSENHRVLLIDPYTVRP